MTELWKSFFNDISVDVTTLSEFQGSNNLSAMRDITKLFPFKIVTLDWLVENNLMFPLSEPATPPATKQVVYPFTTTDGNTLVIYSNAFKLDSPYLPISDIVLSTDSTNATIPQVILQNTPVVLIKNDPNYCNAFDNLDIQGSTPNSSLGPIVPYQGNCKMPYFFCEANTIQNNDFMRFGAYLRDNSSNWKGAGVYVNPLFMSYINNRPPQPNPYVGVGGNGNPWLLNLGSGRYYEQDCGSTYIFQSTPYNTFVASYASVTYNYYMQNLAQALGSSGDTPFSRDMEEPDTNLQNMWFDILPSEIIINDLPDNSPLDWAKLVCLGKLINYKNCNKFCDQLNSCNNNNCIGIKTITYTADGISTAFGIPFNYPSSSSIQVLINNSATTDFTLTNDNIVPFVIPSNGQVITINVNCSATPVLTSQLNAPMLNTQLNKVSANSQVYASAQKNVPTIKPVPAIDPNYKPINTINKISRPTPDNSFFYKLIISIVIVCIIIGIIIYHYKSK